MFPFTSFRLRPPCLRFAMAVTGRHDSVRSCSLGFAAAAISDGSLQRACKAQPAQIPACAAIAALRDLLRPPDGMMAIEVGDGRRVFAPADSSPAEVKRQLAKKAKAS